MMDEIYAHAGREAPRECCGLVVQEDNKERYIPLDNISENANDFKIDPKTFVKYQLISNIKYVVHSHYNQDCRPSEVDKKQCREVGIPYLIVSYPDKQYGIYQP
jgi:proteasome lid subunit RPN8/RPN11